jgi:eukaryotic-like serine/threonine-protein kinase
MTTTPPQNEWPTQAQDAPTMIVENGAPGGAPVPPPIDPRRRAFNEIWPWLLVLVLAILLGIGALWWYQDRHKKQDSSTTPATQPNATTPIAAKVATPKVTGLKQSAAAAALTQAGLKPMPKPVKSNAAAGTVIAQRPVAGTRVRRGSDVALDVAAGKPAVAVPDVTGRLARDAVTALHDAGFKTVVVFVPSTQPKGTIVAEAPAAGTKAPSGSTIRLNIAKGPVKRAKPAPTPTTSVPASTRATPTTPVTTASTPTNTAPAPKPTAVTVPDVTTQAILPAIRTLEQAGLHTQVTLVDSSQPAGRVISQLPTAQSKADKGEVVQLNVSLGPNPAQLAAVPDVTGKDVQQATQALNDAGFTVQTVDRKVTGATQDAKVLDEQPAGQAPQDFTIILIVGRTG